MEVPTPPLDRPRLAQLGSRIKRLRGMSNPQYRLRVGEVQVFYDVTGGRVEILAVVLESEASKWLEEEGKKQ